MSKGIREGKKITFTDGKEREIFPLSIRNLRRVMKVMKGLDEVDQMSDDNINTLLGAARVILEKVDPKTVEASVKAQEERKELFDAGDEDAAWEVEDPLEDLLDVETVNLVIGAGMGTDPNV